MKKILKTLLFVACMTLFFSVTVFAEGGDYSGSNHSGGESGSTTEEYRNHGASYNKTGYLIYVADSTGLKVTGTRIVFWPWNGSIDSSVRLTGVKTKAGEFYNRKADVPIPWGTPLFNYDSSDNMISYEPTIRQFVTSPYGGYPSGGQYLIQEYLDTNGMDEAAWEAFVSNDYYLCIEGVLWCGIWDESWGGYSGAGHFAGTSQTWGAKTSNRTKMGKYTHLFLANALYMTEPWMGLTVPSSFLDDNPFYTPDELAYPSGRGMVAYRVGEGGGSDLMVKVYQTNDNSVITHDKTEFVSTSKNPTIAQEADYVPIAWETSKEDAATHPRSPLPWDTVRDTSTHTRSGTPSNPPTLTEEEHVIYVLYEKSPQGPGDLSNERQDWINEWELDYVGVDLAGRDQTITKAYFNYDSATRTDHTTDAGYVADSQKDDDSSYEEVITGTVATQFQRWVSNGCNWKYGGGNFPASDVVVPHYAYTSSRSIWEPNVYVSAYRCLRELGSSYATYRDFILNILKIPEGVVHSAGTSGSSSQKRFQLSPVGIADEYTFTGTAKRSWKIHHDRIPEDGHYDHKVYQSNPDGSKTYKKDSSGNDEWYCPGGDPAGWIGDNTTSLWHKTSDEVPAWDEAKSESYDMSNPSSIVYKMSHNCYKFYPFTTPVGSLPSTSLPDSYKVLYKKEQTVPAIAGSKGYQTFVGAGEAPDTLTVVPEVQMTLNYTSNGWSVVPVDVYVMGELERKMHPAMIQGYRLANATLIDGWTSLASPETGDSATEAFDTVGVRDDSLIAGVTQLGTAFDVAETTAPIIQVVTMAVDVSSNVEGYDLKSTWGNSGWNPEVQHNNYLSQFLADDAITQELYIQYYKNDSTSTGLLSDYVQLVATGSGVRQSPTAVSEVPVYFKDGSVTNKVDVINAIKDAYGVNDADANTIYNNWGFDTPVGPNVSQLNAVFESSTDGNNPSRDDNGAKWYDEETIALVIKTYKTNITLFQASAEDKVDYNTLKSAASKNAIEGRVFVRIKMDDALTQFQAGSVAQPYDAKCIYWGELPHARFIVSPENSSNMRK